MYGDTSFLRGCPLLLLLRMEEFFVYHFLAWKVLAMGGRVSHGQFILSKINRWEGLKAGGGLRLNGFLPFRRLQVGAGRPKGLR